MREGKIGRGFALALVLGLTVMLAAAVGCGGREETTTPTGDKTDVVKVTKIAVITPEKGNDYGWNQQGVEGAQAAADVGRRRAASSRTAPATATSRRS